MSITLEDIARLAGVNPATVSRTISKPEKVKPKTRQKIETIIKQTGYIPNLLARGLAKGRTDSVGILTSFTTNPYIIEIIESLERQLTADGTYMYLCNCQHDFELEKKYLNELMQRKIDGLFVIETPSLNTKYNFYAKNNYDCPVIQINQHLKPYKDSFIVCCDQKPGIEEIFNEVKKNRLYPFILLIPAEKSYSYMIKERLFIKWFKKNNLTKKQAQCIKLEIIGPNDEKSVWSSYKAAKELIPRFKPRSILTGNDLMAMGVLSAAHELGISIPRDLAIAGVDNTLFARTSMPALSTIDLRMGEVGNKAAELYRNFKNNRQTYYDKVIILPSIFIRRKTF